VSASLYNDALVRLARLSLGKGRLASASATSTLDNPLCGDRVTIDVAMEGDRLVGLAHEVKGCLLCEAAASTIAELFPGKQRSEIKAGIAAISQLMQEGTLPAGQWPAMEVFTPVHSTRSRRNCVLLPFRALERAIDQP